MEFQVKAVVYLFLICTQRIFCDNQEVLSDVADVETDTDDVDFHRLENEFAMEGNTSTSTEVYGNATIPKIPISTTPAQTDSKNLSDFKPSVHLGTIEEPKSMDSVPFNKVNHLKFNNYLSATPDPQTWRTDPSRINNESNHFERINVDQVIDPKYYQKQKFFPPSSSNENRYFREPDDGVSFPQQLTAFHGENFQTALYTSQPQMLRPIQRPEFSVNSIPEKNYFETNQPQEYQPHQAFGYSQQVPFVEEINYVTPYKDGIPNFDFKNQLNFETYEERPNPIRPHHDIQEVARPHKFPYKFYQEPPIFMDGNLEYLPNEQVVHPIPISREKRLSPWKKIIHLLGTILPFGLLLATLSPRVIQIGNSTQSTIPLSKFKEVNLPPEHKSMRMDEGVGPCEEKDICETILAGSKPKSNLLQNVLWNIVTRTPEGTAKDNDLRELFQAVKKRDCNMITC